jgi:hypothetical protein
MSILSDLDQGDLDPQGQGHLTFEKSYIDNNSKTSRLISFKHTH